MNQPPDTPTVWARAHGETLGEATLRETPEDFRVWEISAAQPTGSGEHLLLEIRKTGANTDWVAGRLARLAGIKRTAVGFAGQKDRHAVTEQWFSLHMPGCEDPPFGDWAIEGVEILSAVRHDRKLRAGALLANRFEIVLRDLTVDRAAMTPRLQTLRQAGFPNYFGDQRFGRQGENLRRGTALLVDRVRMRKGNARGMAVSAVRSFLFNSILDARVRTETWNRIVAGEQVRLDGTQSGFLAEQVSEDLQRRAVLGDIHPSGPLWGRGGLQSATDARAAEARAVEPYAPYLAGLEALGLKTERRALRVVPGDLDWGFPAADVLRLRFQLPRGAYATALLRELVQIRDAGGPATRAGDALDQGLHRFSNT
jgi:tRNA pseudouridine13 synthase